MNVSYNREYSPPVYVFLFVHIYLFLPVLLPNRLHRRHRCLRRRYCSSAAAILMWCLARRSFGSESGTPKPPPSFPVRIRYPHPFSGTRGGRMTSGTWEVFVHRACRDLVSLSSLVRLGGLQWMPATLFFHSKPRPISTTTSSYRTYPHQRAQCS